MAFLTARVSRPGVARPLGVRRAVAPGAPVPRTAPPRPAATALAATAAPLDVAPSTLPNSRTELTVTVPADQVAAAYKTALAQARGKVSIPGFRKGGKIPDSLLIDAMGGPAAAKAAAAEVLLNDTLPVALGPYAETAISGSEAVTDNIDALAASLDPTGACPFTYHVGFDTLPPVKWTGPYKGLKLSVQAAGDADADIPTRAAAQLLAARKEKGALRVAAAVRPASPALAQGDAAVIDFDLVESATGQSIPGAARAGMQVDTDLLGAALGLPGLVEGMLGMAPGETRDIPLTMPADWADPPHLAGAAVTAKIAVRDVLAWELPGATDAWADATFPGSPPGVAGLISRFGDAIAAEDAAATAIKVEDALADAVAAAVEMDVPESVIQEVGQETYQAELLQAATSGGIAASQVAQLATPALLARFIAARRDQLAELYRAQAGLEAIFVAEGLSVDEKAVAAELSAARKAYAEAGEELDEDRLREQVTTTAQRRATVEWLKANNEVAVGPPARPKRAFRAG